MAQARRRHSQTSAFCHAGANTGRKFLLRKPQVKAAIDARLKELEDKRIAKADEVMQFLTSALRGEPHDVDE